MTYKNEGSYESSPPCTTQQDGEEPLCAGWRNCIGCHKLQVSFRKRATSSRALSAKEPLVLGLFCRQWPTTQQDGKALSTYVYLRKETCNLWQTMHFRHHAHNLYVSFATELYKREYILQKRRRIGPAHRDLMWALMQSIVSFIRLFCKRDL